MTQTKKKIRPAATTRTGKRLYQAETLALPPLQMVLVHAQNDRANAAAEPVAKSRSRKALTQQEAVIKIIEHLTKIQ